MVGLQMTAQHGGYEETEVSLVMRTGIWASGCRKGYGVWHKLGHGDPAEMGCNLWDNDSWNVEAWLTPIKRLFCLTLANSS